MKEICFDNTDCLNNNLTYNTSAKINAQYINYPCAYFSSTNAKLQMPVDKIFKPKAISFQAWIPSTIPNNIIICPNEKIEDGNNTNYLTGLSFTYKNEKFVFQPHTNFVNSVSSSPTHEYVYATKNGLKTSDWNNFYFDDTGLYINGIKNEVETINNNILTNVTEREAYFNLADGCLANIKFYSDNLTDEEIQNCLQYDREKLEHWWPLSENYTLTVNDILSETPLKFSNVTSSVSIWNTKIVPSGYDYNNEKGYYIFSQDVYPYEYGVNTNQGEAQRIIYDKVIYPKSEVCVYKQQYKSTDS